ncbi:MAG: PEP-CTERM sorting domain-containing protein [Planctomycetota bacterium]
MTSAHANVTVGLTPGSNTDNRFIDALSNSYAQVGLNPEGMYSLANDQLQGPPVDAFPLNDNWANLGTLILDAPVTPSSSGTFNIVNTSGFDFDSVIDGAVVSIFAGFGGGDYATILTPTSGQTNFGTVTLLNGSVTDLDFDASVNFLFQGFFAYDDGTLSITENSFTLDIDDTVQPSPQSPAIQQIWDFDGTVSTNVIPEPSVGVLIALGGLSLVRRRRFV